MSTNEVKVSGITVTYNGEKTLIYNNQSYAIYRTYHGKNDRLELYTERKGGTNGC